MDNNIGNEGAISLADCLRDNSTLTELDLRGDNIEEKEYFAIDTLLGWKHMEPLSPSKIKRLKPPCQNRVMVILLILNQLPICDHLHWNIMTMLKVRDVVSVARPYYIDD